MVKIRIVSVGKTKESWLEEALSEYVKRLSKKVLFEFVFVKDDEKLLALLDKALPLCILLDPAGNKMTSEGFSTFLESQLEEKGSKVTFVIGGPEGLPKILKKNATLISLSEMTFTHQITRLILLEQIYRAFCISSGSPYHK
jgi:23S rRNA (pseudouridine1915-N3)-methyltransferase